ncbi:MAG: hypothetical protein AAF543_12575, partial [Pseudomonadota bacterium]
VALGVPAVLLMLGIILTTLGRAVILARYYPSTAPALMIALVCFSMLTIGMSEPVFLEKHTFDWMLLVAVAGAARALTANLGNEQQTTAGIVDDGPKRRLPEGVLRGYPT